MDELAANGREALPGLIRCCELSAQLHAIEHDGEVLALYGFADLGDGVACPWLLGSDALVTSHRRWLIRNTATIVASGDGRWHSFRNFVDARNVQHVRWLRWAGFVLDCPISHGPFALQFHPFVRTTTCV